MSGDSVTRLSQHIRQNYAAGSPIAQAARSLRPDLPPQEVATVCELIVRIIAAPSAAGTDEVPASPGADRGGAAAGAGERLD